MTWKRIGGVRLPDPPAGEPPKFNCLECRDKGWVIRSVEAPWFTAGYRFDEARTCPSCRLGRVNREIARADEERWNANDPGRAARLRDIDRGRREWLAAQRRKEQAEAEKKPDP